MISGYVYACVLSLDRWLNSRGADSSGPWQESGLGLCRTQPQLDRAHSGEGAPRENGWLGPLWDDAQRPATLHPALGPEWLRLPHPPFPQQNRRTLNQGREAAVTSRCRAGPGNFRFLRKVSVTGLAWALGWSIPAPALGRRAKPSACLRMRCRDSLLCEYRGRRGLTLV